MKLISAKLLGLLLLVLLTAAITVKAGHGRQHGPAAREIRAYYQANVLPVLRQQRQKLEPQLAAADQAQLATYRAQLQALHQRGQALRKSLRPTEAPAAGTRPTLTDEQKAQLKQLHTDHRAIMDNVAKLATKYEAVIQQLAAEVAPQREKWTADVKAIAAKNATPEQLERRQHHGKLGGHHGLGNAFRPARFLLMNPQAPAETTRDLGATSVYPNPVMPGSQLDYEVKKAGPVSIELLDARGNKVRTLLQNQQQEKGPHTQLLNASDLPAGTYYYKITTRSGTETKRFVKE